jgi:phosphatidylglycerol---prolipoprotein diacylglyceryl transferase
MPGIQIYGDLWIRYYALILMAGAVAGAWLATREARRRNLDPDIVWDALFWLLIAGIIGARLWHILFPPASMVAQGIDTWFYLTHPLDAINTTKGGLGIPGAVIGGALALYMFCRKRKLSFATWIDIGAPAVALGQVIGRWGNYINQEVYGYPTDLPWAVTIDEFHRMPGYENFATYHPLFLYESLWNLALLGLLLYLGRRFADRLIAGDLFLVYLIGYPLGRFLLEFLRLDAAELGGINANQAMMAVIGLAAAGLLFARHRFGWLPPAPTPQPRLPAKDRQSLPKAD